ncbi:SusC/RagA family TonB-linked outer membrane protein [Olivibacter sp. SDN3]|uniref:SusC/RagA family TonB-linked outer membrane protein n=1 Tax=Olivibacter sp. SDN3 TaxID=2764720 RepID=UPI0016510CDD|nr:SusC/RagA family TonB-linked outer membrane protein [Olivibacter sp. SDN3]QNL48144.1 SusC/RagA family TonB-linked outer membrane protein [Olivibacter sp. SDN3]
MKLFTSYIRELFARKFKRSVVINTTSERFYRLLDNYYVSQRPNPSSSTSKLLQRASNSIRHTFETSSTLLRESFDTCSGRLRLRFDCSSAATRSRPERYSKNSRTNHNHKWQLTRCITSLQSNEVLGTAKCFLHKIQYFLYRYTRYRQPTLFVPASSGKGSTKYQPAISERLYDVCTNISARRYLIDTSLKHQGTKELNRGKALRVGAFKNFALIGLTSLFCVCLAHARQQEPPYRLHGTVSSAATGVALEGATVKILNRNGVITDERGEFTLSTRDSSGHFFVSYLGYKAAKITFDINTLGPFQIQLEPADDFLEEVVVSSGYQEINKERATGSFEQVNEELLNRRVSTNILDRLDGVTSGTLFNTHGARQPGQSDLQIRGRSTLFGNADPLIILDNFPYDGDLGSINPNDIENISILKDASAASIWGVRAGNGVIVLTTKKGSLNAKPQISFNGNVTIGEKPDIYRTPQLSSAEFIEVERDLFDRGHYNATINNGYAAISPVVQLLLDEREGVLSIEELNSRLDALGSMDARDDIRRYFQRTSVNQQYQLNIRGGGPQQKYYLSAGYDSNRPDDVTESYNRFTLNATHSYGFLNNRLEFTTGLFFTKSADKQQGVPYNNATYPYQLLADERGNPLAVPNTLRLNYVDTVGQGRLLNWDYRPLEELRSGATQVFNNFTNLRIQGAMRYEMLPGLNAHLQYVHERGMRELETHQAQHSYYTRNLINTYTQIDAATGAVFHAVPMGDVLNTRTTTSTLHNGRLQLNFDRQLGNDHHINAVAGYEIKDYSVAISSIGLYGYDPETATNNNAAVNYTAQYPIYYSNGTGRIPTNTGRSGTVDRYTSYFTNVIYTLKDRYIISGSARKDASNLFGVKSNQRGVPLWSAGAAWVLSAEDFYKFDLLSLLKLRATYGYNGNVNKSVSAYLTAQTGRWAHNWNVPYYEITNPPNEALRWEKIRNVNLGLDFVLKGDVIRASVEIWSKKGEDLIGSSPIAPQTGVTMFTGNTASTSSKGWEVNLTSANLDRNFRWSTTYIFNMAKDEVIKYLVANGSNYNVVNGNYDNPLEGYPQFSIFSFRWDGLDALGNPWGSVSGERTDNYSAITNSLNRDDLVFNGSAVPTVFGSLRNDFSYRRLSLSINLVYKMGHFFRRPSLNNVSLYAGDFQQADYGSRWQKPGDEMTTNVPALAYPANMLRENFYTYADVLVERGDLIRLQDVQLNLNLGRTALHNVGFRNLNIYAYVNNVGVFWAGNKKGIDPDFPFGIPAPRTYAFGIKADF